MKKRYRKISISQYLVVSLAILVAIGLGFLSTVIMRQVPFEDHFVIPWSAGRVWLLDGGDPYSDQVIQLADQTLVNSAYQGQLPTKSVLKDPIMNLIFTIPFSLLPYEVSRAVWVVVVFASIGLIGFFALKLSGWKVSMYESGGTILLLAAWFSSIQAALMGLLSPIVILLILAAIYAILKKAGYTCRFSPSTHLWLLAGFNTIASITCDMEHHSQAMADIDCLFCRLGFPLGDHFDPITLLAVGLAGRHDWELLRFLLDSYPFNLSGKTITRYRKLSFNWSSCRVRDLSDRPVHLDHG